MERLLPSRVNPSQPDDPKVFGLEDETSQDALQALSSETARRILSELYDEPRSPTDLRDTVGTSLQNVHYHLEKLQSAELIREVGTRYSEKGNEMSVYGPASQAVVFMAGDRENKSRLKRALGRVVGAVGVLAGASLGFGALLEWLRSDPTKTGSGSGPEVMTTDGGTADAASQAASTLDPALAFFLGGAFILAVLGSWWAVRRYRAGG